MKFYDYTKAERAKIVAQIKSNILADLMSNNWTTIKSYFSDKDTYIRKSAYQATGKIWREQEKLKKAIISMLEFFLTEQDSKIRQTSINAAGEIGMQEFECVEYFFDQGLFDPDHTVRNAVIGSIKKMGEKNSKRVLEWAKKYLNHPDKEIRREICHGIELRGRTHPQDILPLLQELQHDKTSRVRKTLIHVLGQIAYKKGCLATVISHLKNWENKELIDKALEEIIDVHERYKNFTPLSKDQAEDYIFRHIQK